MSAPTRDEVIRLMAEIGKEYSQLIDEYFKNQMTDYQRKRISGAWHKCLESDDSSKPIGILSNKSTKGFKNKDK